MARSGFKDLNDHCTLAVNEIRVDTIVLTQYVGVYEGSNHPVLITIENGQLQMAAPDGGLPKSSLFPKSGSTFFLKVIQLVIHYKGQIQLAKKVK